MVKIPQPPTVIETAPGHLQVDPAELKTYTEEMRQFQTLFDEAISGCDPDDPDAIIAAMMNKLLNNG